VDLFDKIVVLVDFQISSVQKWSCMHMQYKYLSLFFLKKKISDAGTYLGKQWGNWAWVKIVSEPPANNSTLPLSWKLLKFHPWNWIWIQWIRSQKYVHKLDSQITFTRISPGDPWLQESKEKASSEEEPPSEHKNRIKHLIR